MKKILSLVLAFCLMLSVSAAYASVGDMTVYHTASDDYSSSVSNILVLGSQIWMVFQGSTEYLMIYDRAANQTMEYDLTSALSSSGESAGFFEGEWRNIACWFIWRNEVCALMTVTHYDNENGTSSVENVSICRVVLHEQEKTASLEPVEDAPELDWSYMTQDYGGWSESRYVYSGFCQEDTLYFLVSDDDGNQVLECYDLTSGDCEEKYIENISNIIPYGNGRLIVCQNDWSHSPATIVLSLYDPASEELQERCTFTEGNNGLPNLWCCRPADDTLFYTLAGEIFAAPGFDLASAYAVNECPSDRLTAPLLLMEDGYLVMRNWNSVLVRATDPSLRSSTSLRVMDLSYTSALDDAYYDFIAGHGDVSLVISHPYSESSGILQAMMNQDGAVDIYCLKAASSEYQAVYTRGYIAPLDASAALTGSSARMYRNMDSVLKKDGALVAIPLQAYGTTIGYNPTSLANLGMTPADIPTTWDGFFDFLEALPQKLEGTQVRAFYQWSDQFSLRQTLVEHLLSSYEAWLSAGGDSSWSFNTPLLAGLFHRLEALDLGALEVEEGSGGYEEDSEEEVYVEPMESEWDERDVLINTYASVTLSGSSMSEMPFVLGFGDEAPRAGYSLYVAFINPYSSHIPEAMSFLETLSDSISLFDQYDFYTDLNEPVRYPTYEEDKKYLQETLENMRAEYETSDDEENRETLLETIEYLEKELADYDEKNWMISPNAISAYRGVASSFYPQTWDYMAAFGDDLYSAINEYLSGRTTAEDFLTSIDKKVQLMRLEDN